MQIIKMKILHFIPGYLYGGIESMYLSWYKHIDHNQVQFELLLRTQDDNAQALREYRELGGKYYRLAPFSVRNIKEHKRSIDEFFESHHDYDIMHVHDDSPFVMHSAKKYGIKNIVFHSHTAGLDRDIKEYLKNLDETKNIYLYANYAFADSELAASWRFGGKRFKGHEVEIIHNAINTADFDYNEAKRNDVRKRQGWDGYHVIGHVGRFAYAKNQFFLLDIFAELLKMDSKAHLVMVGDGAQGNMLKEHAKSLGISNCVEFLGVRDDVATLLQGMDCFLLPSQSEGLSIATIEAQTSGIPCVISDVIPHEVDITDLVYRCSLTASPEIWARRITEVCSMTTRKSTREAVISSRFDIQSATENLIATYRQILKKRRSDGRANQN